MKKSFFILLLFIAVKLSIGQTVITLDLPDPCYLEGIENETLNQSDGFNLSVSPNPNDGRFIMSLSCNEAIGKVKIKLFNTQGVCILTEKIYSGAQKCVKQIDTGKLPAGLYSLTVYRGKQSQTVKLLIDKKK